MMQSEFLRWPADGAALSAALRRLWRVAREEPHAGAFRVYLLTVFVYSFAGVGPGRIGLGLCLAWLVVSLVRRRERPAWPPVAVWAAAYLVWIGLAVQWGPAETRSLNELHKLLPWLQIPIAATLLRSRRRLVWVWQALALGSLVLALRTLSGSAQAFVEAVRAGAGWEWAGAWERLVFHRELVEDDLLSRLIQAGSIRDAQRLMVGLLAWRAGWASAPSPGGSDGDGGRRLGRRIGMALVALALLLTFKRGAWGMLPAVAGIHYAQVWMARRRPWRRGWRDARAGGGCRWYGACRGMAPGMAAGMAAAVLLVLGLEGTRLERRIEPMIQRGGRACMWFQITPELARRHPFGIGYKRLTNTAMRAIAPQVEPNRDHVHSTPLQSLVDGGWFGLLLFLGWMLQAFRDARCAFRGSRRDAAEGRLALALGWTLLALAGVGVVEYQFGSGQIVLLYGLLMGAAAALRAQVAAKA